MTSFLNRRPVRYCSLPSSEQARLVVVVDTEEEAKTLVYHLNYEIKAWHGDAKKVLNATAFLDEKWAKEHIDVSRELVNRIILILNTIGERKLADELNLCIYEREDK